MIIELHLLQNFVPSNLNRDDTGSPKDCEFGGYRRARISSQCLKRAMRKYVASENLLDSENLGYRTRRLLDHLVKRLEGKDEEQAKSAITKLLAARKIQVDDEKTQYLLFLGENEINGLAKLIHEHWDVLSADAEGKPKEEGKKKSSKEKKKEGAQAIPAEIGKAIDAIFHGSKAADVAMFGRMAADVPGFNVDAACQVAHAISTNKADIEFDYFTAVDDLMPNDETGAGMIGTVELTSACFYRYAAIHGKQLVDNLHGDEDLAEKTVLAFLRAAVEAVPSGKQNSTAAHNPPSFVMAVVRPSGCVNLANAFVKPVSPKGGEDLVGSSIKSLAHHWQACTRMYSPKGLTVAVATESEDVTQLGSLRESIKPSVDNVYAAVAEAIKGKLKENGR